MANPTSSGATASSKPSEDEIIPLHFLDLLKPIDNIRTLLFFVVESVLDEDIMRKALDTLIRQHFRILGSRIEAGEGHMLQYRLPASFPDDYSLFGWTSTEVPTTFAEASVLGPVPTSTPDKVITFYPSVSRLEEAWTPKDWPRERKHEKPDCPLLLVHITHYRDATVVSTNLPHAMSDQMGYATIIKAWIDIMRGDEPPPLQQTPGGGYEGADLTKAELKKGKGVFRLISPRERRNVLLGFIPEMVLHNKEDRRTLFFSEQLLKVLRDRYNRELEEKLGKKAVVLTTSDVIVGILLKFGHLHRKKPKMITLSGAINLRGRHPAFPASQAYPFNAVNYGASRFPVSRSTRVLDIAVQNREAVNRGIQRETIDHENAVKKAMVRKGISIHICEPFEFSFSSTNWSGSWRGIDFTPAAKGNESSEDSSETQNAQDDNHLPLVFGYSGERSVPVLRFSTQIMSKARGGYWVDFSTAVKNMKPIDDLLERDPCLETI